MSLPTDALSPHATLLLSQAVSSAFTELISKPDTSRWSVSSQPLARRPRRLTDRNERPDLWATIRGAVQVALQDSIRKHNQATAPVMRMPSELLCETFKHLALADRAAAAAVCHRWRATSDTCRIVVQDGVPLGVLRGLLRQTGAAPLEFERVAYKNAADTAYVLLPHMPRVRRLALHVTDAPLPGLFTTLLQAAAPQLRSFGLECAPEQRPRSDGLFAEDGAPRLQSCVLRGVRNGLSLALTLTHLRTLACAGPLTAREICRALTTLERLERLDLRITAWSEAANDVRRTPCAPPPSLRRLALASSSLESPSRVLDFVAHRAIAELNISYAAPPELQQTVAQIVADVRAATEYAGTAIAGVEIRALRPGLASTTYVVRATDSAGRRRIFSSISRAAVLAVLQSTALSRAVSVSVDSPGILLGLRLPAMQSLTLHSGRYDAADSLFWNTISCPALQRVVLSATLSSLPSWFPEFCTRTLARGFGPLLRSIELYGVRCDESDFEPLFAAADAVHALPAVPAELLPDSEFASVLGGE